MITDLNYRAGYVQHFLFCVCVCVAAWEPLPSRIRNDVTGAFQRPLRVGRTLWRDRCVLPPDWIIAECSCSAFFLTFFFGCASHRLSRSARSIKTFLQMQALVFCVH